MIPDQEYIIENREWLKSFEWVIRHESPKRAEEILGLLSRKAAENNISFSEINTPYINSLPPIKESEYPGDLEIEKKLTGIVRWNAIAMVVRANKKNKGIGGHISTYASVADLFEVGFNHFFKIDNEGTDMIYFQGHASPGVYARSFTERRFDEETLDHFRLEVQSNKSLSSYPHPRLMKITGNFPLYPWGFHPYRQFTRQEFASILRIED
jgi:pyruvate dehydrogenase E1 component